MFAFLSARFRNYLLFALVLPLFGRVLETVGMRVAPRNRRAGELLTQAGGFARRPATRRARRRRR